MKRREFLAGSVGAIGAGLTGSTVSAAGPASRIPLATKPFRLKYAPNFGTFRSHVQDPIEALKFMHDQGFRAIEDNWMSRKEVPLQEKIAKEMARLGMEMGVFVAHFSGGKPTFVKKDKATADALVSDMEKAVEVAKRVRAKWCTVVPGAYDPKLEWGYQTANAVDNLRRCAEVCEPSGLTMVLEPLNPWANHPGLFLSKIPQAYEICRAVNSPSCKILDDLYHQQITEGNLIPNMNLAWSEIAYFQIGDNPGRKEPTTGEINYKNIFKHIHGRGYQGILGMEHGKAKPGKEGELALLKAYQECDSF